jgi:hypothetical protein
MPVILYLYVSKTVWNKVKYIIVTKGIQILKAELRIDAIFLTFNSMLQGSRFEIEPTKNFHELS